MARSTPTPTLRALALPALAGAVEWEELHADNFDETLGDSEASSSTSPRRGRELP